MLQISQKHKISKRRKGTNKKSIKQFKKSRKLDKNTWANIKSKYCKQ